MITHIINSDKYEPSKDLYNSMQFLPRLRLLSADIYLNIKGDEFATVARLMRTAIKNRYPQISYIYFDRCVVLPSSVWFHVFAVNKSLFSNAYMDVNLSINELTSDESLKFYSDFLRHQITTVNDVLHSGLWFVAHQ